MRLRALTFRAAAVLIGTAVGLVVGEATLRILGYTGDDRRAATVFEPAFGTVEKDSWAVGFDIDPGTQRQVSIREQVIPLEKEPGETRILFIGDSGTEGAHVALPDAYPARVEALLSRKYPERNVRAINAGVWGMTTIDEYHFLRARLLLLNPDIVVLGLFMANDINFNLGHRQKRLQGRPASPAVRRLVDRSALSHYLFLKALALNDRHKLFNTGSLGKWTLIPVELGLFDSHGFHMLNYPAGEVATYMRRSSALIDHAFEVLREVFEKFKALSGKHGFVFRVVIIPTPSAVANRLRILHHPDILQELRAQGVNVTESDLDFAKPTRRVLEICKGLDIECIDPTRRMRRIGPGVFFPGDEHLTPAGHEGVARQMVGN